jgi:hypothetical protein
MKQMKQMKQIRKENYEIRERGNTNKSESTPYLLNHLI